MNHYFKIKNFIFIILTLSLFTLLAWPIKLEALPNSNQPKNEAPNSEQQSIKAKINSDDFIEFGKKALFDASESVLIDKDAPANYFWDFSDTSRRQYGKEILHEFKNTGIHKVTLTVIQKGEQAKAEKKVFVYDKQVLMVTDKNVAKELDLIINQAANNGVFLKIITATGGETGFLTEEKLVSLIGEESDFIKQANAIIFYTKSSLGLQAFTRYWQNLENKKELNLSNKLLVKITDQSMSISAELAQQSYKVLPVKYILLTRPEALNPILEEKNYNKLISVLESRAIETRIIDSRSEKSKIFFLSHTISKLISKGIPTNTIYLLLALPFIAFLITFSRQVVGLTTFGIYTPLVVSLSFFILGPYFGIATLLLIIVVSYILRAILNKIKLLYLPKTGLILSGIGLSFLSVIWFLSYYRISMAISLAVFPMLVLSTISEKFLSAQSEEGLKNAFLGTIKTIFVSITAYLLVVWPSFLNLIMSWPELIIAPILGMFILGKFTGLRLDEYIRFRSLFKESNIEE